MDKVEPLEDLIDKAKTTGVLFGEELLHFQVFFSLGIRVKSFVDERREDYPDLWGFIRKIRDFQKEHLLLGVIDADGRLYDHASPNLETIRYEMQNLKRQARSVGSGLLSNTNFTGKLQERVLAFRNGRFMVLVRKEHINSFSGILHDMSSSRNSAYMEPASLVSLNNKLSAITQEEKNEERKIFRELTQGILLRENALRDLEEVIAFLDALYGITRVQEEKGWAFPLLDKRRFFSLERASHPLLGDKAVPLNIHCGQNHLSIIITGPNTGGKTVALKTVATILLLTWSGLPSPIKESSVVGAFDTILVDIGDEQSITQSLSTFSGHVKNIMEMLDQATHRSLILLDELGAGTDPQEGAALGIAILEAFLHRRSLVLATTHHTPLKRYAMENSDIEAASMEFNPVTASPTYRLLLGIPGASNAILIAQRYGLDKDIVERARQISREGEQKQGHLENSLYEKEILLRKKESELLLSLEETEKERKKLQEHLYALEQKKSAILEEFDKKARKVLVDAESKATALVRAAETGSHKSRETKKLDVKKLKRSIDAREEKRSHIYATNSEEVSLRPGMFVEVLGKGLQGEVVEIKKNQAVLQIGALRIEAPLTTVRAAKGLPPAKKHPKPVFSSRKGIGYPKESIASSLMIRGMTVDEAIPLVEIYLDKAFRFGHKAVTIIHGRGEGILRRKVHSLCKTLPYVTSYTLGGPGDGGIGVTIIEF